VNRPESHTSPFLVTNVGCKKRKRTQKTEASYNQMQMDQIERRLNQKDYCKTLQKLVEYVLLLNVVCGFLNSPYLF
jgi:hypothetical protein